MCCFPSCEHKDIYARGICWYHYKLFMELVDKKIRTWNELEEVEYCLPKRYSKGVPKKKKKYVPPLQHKYAHLLDEKMSEGKSYKQYIKPPVAH